MTLTSTLIPIKTNQSFNPQSEEERTNLRIIFPPQNYLILISHLMLFTHSKDNKKIYEIEIKIKAFKKISELDREKINKVALILDSLGYEEKETSEKLYRFTSEKEKGELLIDVEDCSGK